MPADSAIIRRVSHIALICMVTTGWVNKANAGDPEDAFRVRKAIAYLDGRQDDWSQFAKSQRGEGVDRTACVSCHTGLSYALARPVLRPFGPTSGPGAPEGRMIAAVSLRVEHWDELDSPRFRLMYDHDDHKEVESRGTEAVLNALVLALDDTKLRRTTPGAATRTAMRHLWATQATEGNAGSWDWLNFGLEPWEANGSPAFGAALAAIAVGSAPGYLGQALDEDATRGVRSLRDYLRKRFPEESLFNRLWILEASTTLDGLRPTRRVRSSTNSWPFGARTVVGPWPPSGTSSGLTAQPSPRIRMLTQPGWRCMRCFAPDRLLRGPRWPGVSAGSGPINKVTARGRAGR